MFKKLKPLESTRREREAKQGKLYSTISSLQLSAYAEVGFGDVTEVQLVRFRV